MKLIVYKCSFCKKLIIATEEDEKIEELINLCPVHFKYVCKTCEKEVGKCEFCSGVKCSSCYEVCNWVRSKYGKGIE
jgi:DNA-directed RNA polymerase subunit RPC12/RpoP